MIVLQSFLLLRRKWNHLFASLNTIMFGKFPLTVEVSYSSFEPPVRKHHAFSVYSGIRDSAVLGHRKTL